eukprot:305735-Amphidinium_carterae.1
MHTAHSSIIEVHTSTGIHVCKLPSILFLDWLKLGPLGSCLVFSMLAPSSIRVMLLMCDVYGAIATATLFFSTSGGAPSKKNPAQCSSDMDFWESVGRLLALGIASGVLAAFPCGVLSSSTLTGRGAHFGRSSYDNGDAWMSPSGSLVPHTWHFASCT